jgi:hypothetical protein
MLRRGLSARSPSERGLDHVVVDIGNDRDFARQKIQFAALLDLVEAEIAHELRHGDEPQNLIEGEACDVTIAGTTNHDTGSISSASVIFVISLSMFV